MPFFYGHFSNLPPVVVETYVCVHLATVIYPPICYIYKYIYCNKILLKIFNESFACVRTFTGEFVAKLVYLYYSEKPVKKVMCVEFILKLYKMHINKV